MPEILPEVNLTLDALDKFRYDQVGIPISNDLNSGFNAGLHRKNL